MKMTSTVTETELNLLLICLNSRSWWWTGKPGMLQSMGSQRVEHDWVTELNWTELRALGCHLWFLLNSKCTFCSWLSYTCCHGPDCTCSFSLAKFPRKSWAGPVPLCPYLWILAWTYSCGLVMMSWCSLSRWLIDCLLMFFDFFAFLFFFFLIYFYPLEANYFTIL